MEGVCQNMLPAMKHIERDVHKNGLKRLREAGDLNPIKTIRAFYKQVKDPEGITKEEQSEGSAAADTAPKSEGGNIQVVLSEDEENINEDKALAEWIAPDNSSEEVEDNRQVKDDIEDNGDKEEMENENNDEDKEE
ncbi:MAG: hypothetical protein M1832_005380 [Thelocarpon impressellum]|nr:MAG: hypothetical protein M1832_005380 [Thelocarpon impressellum]